MADDSINFQFTAKGQQLASQALAGTVKLDFTKAVASTDNHFSDSVATIAALTTLANVKQTATISEVDRVAEDDTEVRIPVTFDKSQVGDDYQLLTVGLYCKPDNGAEVLYAIAGLANPILMHKSTTDSTYSIDMYVVVGTSDNVTIKVNPAGAVTHADLSTTLSNYSKTADVIKLLAGYEKTADISKSLGDYAKTVDVNQQLDKKVNVADMRKPASDVAGIEEVSTLQTQVDNSAVGTNLIVAKTIKNNFTLTKGDTFYFTGSFTTDYIPVVANQKYTITIYGTTNSAISRIAYYDSSKNFISREKDKTIDTSYSEVIVIPSGASYIKFSPSTPDQSGEYKDNYKIEKGSVATDWCPNPDDKVNVADMRKPASDVAGIEEVNAKADDSRVAHLSGANNFDTVPTVNNNPLLLASSLPSDLARTGSDTNFTAGLQKSGIDVATTDDLTIVYADVQKLIDTAVATATTTLKKYADDAKQAAIDQIQPMITAEFTKRNAPSSWWNGDATAYAAITPKVADAEYDVTES